VGGGINWRPKKKAKQAELETARFSTSKAVACLFSIGSDGRRRKSQVASPTLENPQGGFQRRGQDAIFF